MNTSRNHLTPTPIVDKNGMVTTRHMKTATTTATSGTVIPPVTMGKSSPHPEGSIEQVCELIYGRNDADEHERLVVGLMQEDDKKTLPLAARLLTTGNDIAQSSVRAVLDTALSDIMYAYGESDDDELWRDRCHGAWSPFIKHNMMAAWNVGSLLEETGDSTNPRFLEEDIHRIDSVLNPLATYGDRSADNTYWRGLAAAAMTRVYQNTKDDAKTIRGFVMWAGKHNDVSRVIATATERGTFNVVSLHEIMAEQDRTASPLRQGTL